MTALPARVPRTGLTLLIALAPLVIGAVAYFNGLMPFLYLGAFACVAIAGGVAAFSRPEWAVIFVVFYTFGGLSSVVPSLVAQGLTAAAVAAAFFAILRGDTTMVRAPVFFWALGVFILVNIHSLLWAHDPGPGFGRLIAYAKVFAFVLALMFFIRTPELLRWVARAIFVGAVASMTLGFGAFGLGAQLDTTQEESYFFRFAGLHGNPNDAAQFMCAAIPLGVFMIRRESALWLRVASVVGVAALILGVFLTFSRGGSVSLVVVTLGVILREVRSRGGWIGTAALAAAFVLLSPVEYWERVSNLSHIAENVTEDWSVLIRWRALVTAWELWLENPLTGIGLGNFISRGDVGVWMRIVVHNSYVEVLVETGVFGLIAFLTMIGSGFSSAWSGARRFRVQQPWRSDICWYFGVALASVCASTLFDTDMYRYIIWVPIVGAILATRLPDDTTA